MAIPHVILKTSMLVLHDADLSGSPEDPPLREHVNPPLRGHVNPPLRGHVNPPLGGHVNPTPPRRTEEEVRLELRQLHLQLAELRKERDDRPGNVQQFAQRVS